MKLITWNVNGFRACIKKRFLEFFHKVNADIFCIQEIKMRQDQSEIDLPGYHQYWNSAEKNGYSGTAVFSKELPQKIQYGIGIEEHDHEGRVITLEFTNFFIVNCYTPNVKRDLSRLDYRMIWEDDFRSFLVNLNQEKPVILCGDLNVAHHAIDLRNDKSNIGNAGYTNEERSKLTALLASGFADSFREKYPEKSESYTWWSYMPGIRERNVGWRIDYFILSNELNERVDDVVIHSNVHGRDHCPVELLLLSQM